MYMICIFYGSAMRIDIFQQVVVFRLPVHSVVFLVFFFATYLFYRAKTLKIVFVHVRTTLLLLCARYLQFDQNYLTHREQKREKKKKYFTMFNRVFSISTN